VRDSAIVASMLRDPFLVTHLPKAAAAAPEPGRAGAPPPLLLPTM
jgi:hypothetical protein